MPHHKDNKLQMIRANQTGEFGAVRIYQGQIKALQNTPYVEVLQHMLMQEKKHLALFSELLIKNQMRPSILFPLWSVIGFALGYITAKISPKLAMACTVSIEEVVIAHYKQQEAILEDGEFKTLITQCRKEEEQHLDIGIEYEALQTPAYSIVSAIIKAGTKIAIELSKRI